MRDRLSWSWSILLISDSISSSQYGQPWKLWPESCRFGCEPCFVHFIIVFGRTLWFYVCLVACLQMSNNLQQQQILKNCQDLSFHSFKLLSTVVNMWTCAHVNMCTCSHVNWIGILAEFQNCESVFSPPQISNVRLQSINYCYTSAFYSLLSPFKGDLV